ncbi:hypothetical protein GCM10027589_48120 [Actinocorallia lasiicapitis]
MVSPTTRSLALLRHQESSEVGLVLDDLGQGEFGPHEVAERVTPTRPGDDREFGNDGQTAPTDRESRQLPELLEIVQAIKTIIRPGPITEIRARYPGAEIYFAVFGAMTKGRDLEVLSFDDLSGAGIMRAAGLAAVFVAATMSPPGIEPPLELR